jgi:UDPglucose 6-dehydrogenase
LQRAIELANQALGSLKGKRIAVLGLAFKPETDDVRDAVSISLVRSLLAEGANVIAYDPAAMQNAREIFLDRITYARDPSECIENADSCLIVTEWEEFKDIPPKTFLERMRCPVVIDGRRIYDADRFSTAGTQFLAIGMGPREKVTKQLEATSGWV